LTNLNPFHECGGAFDVSHPLACEIPLVVDSPHSWGLWPKDVFCIAPENALATSWDAYVDQLWRSALSAQAPLLSAKFHRSFIDANRARDDIDPEMLEGAWPYPVRPTEKSDRGFGLIRRYALPNVPVYDRLLTVSEVRSRIENFYDPYHLRLKQLIEKTHSQWGMCLHLNCHSMKSIGNDMNDDSGQVRPDMVVSDLDGVSSSQRLTQTIANLLRDQGYSVNINHPYKGAELIKRYSHPDRKRHSVQIEISRALYMDEKKFEKSVNFNLLSRNLRNFIIDLTSVIKSSEF
jgi:N-formylglutamate deformylase